LQYDKGSPRLDFWYPIRSAFYLYLFTGNQYEYRFTALKLVTDTRESFGKSTVRRYFYRDTDRRYFYQAWYWYQYRYRNSPVPVSVPIPKYRQSPPFLPSTGTKIQVWPRALMLISACYICVLTELISLQTSQADVCKVCKPCL
jgi:hypothetical protein